MRLSLRITGEMLKRIIKDLERPHSFAFERVGFLFCRFGWLDAGSIVALAHAYMPVSDEDYIDDPSFGALIGSTAFRRALGRTIEDALGIFHVHCHAHRGPPFPSRIDVREAAAFVPDFFHVRSDLPHGALILSEDSAWGRAWLAETAQPIPISDVVVVGAPLCSIGGMS